MQKNKQIYINITVSDLKLSTNFYEALGFVKFSDWSNEVASCLKWSEDIFFMLLTKDFMKNFIQEKSFADMNKQADTLFSFMLDSKEQVDEMLKKAESVNAKVYVNKFNEQFDFMYTKSVLDPDGHILEIGFMDMEKAKAFNVAS